ncbi:lecithin retinol acyltransferase family protein [bacterium]|nr:lecithin retinol acyltransferase family protein [bacterium]
MTQFSTHAGGLRPGDEIAVSRGLYTHTGVYVGNSEVVHRAKPWDADGQGGRVVRSTIGSFARGGAVTIRSSPVPHRAPGVVAEALRRVGETGYGMVTANCEHFSTEVVKGKKHSSQVQTGAIVAALLLLVVVASSRKA